MSARVLVDDASLVAEVEAHATLDDVERVLAARGLTLAANGAPHGKTVGAWLDEGAEGAPDPWRDPADHLVAGIEIVLASGAVLAIAPSPRRSVGPDLIALFVGARGRFGSHIARAWLRVHRVAVTERSPSAPHFTRDRNPAVTEDEHALLDAIAREIQSIR